MSATPRRVAIVTGASQGIGEGLVGALRAAGYAVVGTARSIEPSADPDFVTVRGDISEAETAERVVHDRARAIRSDRQPRQQRRRVRGQAVHGVHARRLPPRHRGQPGRLLPHDPARRRADGGPGPGPRRHDDDHPRRPRGPHEPVGADRADQGWARRRDPFTRDRVRRTRSPGERHRRGRHPNPRARRRAATTAWPIVSPSAGWEASTTSSAPSCTSRTPTSSPERRCTSTAVGPPAIEATPVRRPSPPRPRRSPRPR